MKDNKMLVGKNVIVTVLHLALAKMQLNSWERFGDYLVDMLAS